MNRAQWSMFSAAAAMILVAAALLARLQSHHVLGSPGVKVVHQPILGEKGEVVGTNQVALPARVLDYSSEASPIYQVELDWLPKDTTFGRRTYHTPDEVAPTTMTVVLMGTDRTSIHKPQICLTGQGWKIDQSEVVRIPIAEPRPYSLPAMKMLATKEFANAQGQRVTARSVYVYWFVSDEQLTALHGERMWWMATGLLRTGVLQRWAYVSCLSLCYPGQEEATFEKMKRFLGAAVPQFQLTAGAPVEKVASTSALLREPR